MKSFSNISIPDLEIIKEGLDMIQTKIESHLKDFERNNPHLSDNEIMDKMMKKRYRAEELKEAVEAEIFNLKQDV